MSTIVGKTMTWPGRGSKARYIAEHPDRDLGLAGTGGLEVDEGRSLIRKHGEEGPTSVATSQLLIERTVSRKQR